jgi:hypothetical protein
MRSALPVAALLALAVCATTCGGRVVVDDFYVDDPCGAHDTCDDCRSTPGCEWYWPLAVQCASHCDCEGPSLPREGCYPSNDCENGCPAGRECVHFVTRDQCTTCEGATSHACFECFHALGLCLVPDEE